MIPIFYYILPMFIREVKKQLKKSDGTYYTYIQHRLVESIRTEHGPRQQVVLNLGTLSIDSKYFKTLANLIEHKLVNCDQATLFEDVPQEVEVLATHFAQVIKKNRINIAAKKVDAQTQGNTDNKPPLPAYETIDANSIITSDCRSVGVEHIALTQLKELGFFPVLEKLQH